MINHKYDDIFTDRLHIRKAKLDDLDDIYNNIWCDKDIASTMLWKVSNNKEEAINRLERTVEFHKNNYSYFICLKDTDEVIGFGGFREVENEKDVYEDYGLCIAKKYQGMGLAKEATDAFLNIIFNGLNGKRYKYSCFSTNDKSKNVCLGLGFKYLDSHEDVREHDGFKFTRDIYYIDKEDYKEKRLINK